MIAKAAVLALALFASPAIAAPVQFDLDCTGTPPESGNETHRTFRIDLQSMQYCTNDCASVDHLADVTADRIAFTDEDKSSWTLGGAGEARWVDRVTGTYHDRIAVRGNVFDHRMQCDLKPFSGFPQTRF